MERGSASRPTSFYSQTSTSSCCSVSESKLEMRNLMDSFIADVRRIRETFDNTPGADASAASPARSDGDVEMAQPVPGAFTVEPTPPPEEYEHKGIWCDSCNQKVFGIRHKCLDCYNFDLCNSCMTTKDIQSTHADMPHTFQAIHPPQAPKAPARTNSPKPPSATQARGKASFPSHSSDCRTCESPAVQGVPSERALSYRCDSCQNRIAGTRHRCMTCPDFDLCESCYTAGLPTADHSPAHRFMHIEHPIRVITAPAMSSDSTPPLAGGCSHEGPRYKCENCRVVDMCISCLGGDIERASVEHAAFHASQGWDTPVRFVPYTKTQASASTSAPVTSAPVIHSANCDACDEPIVGTRHKCAVCFDFDLCDACFDSGAEPLNHKVEHEILHLDRPQRVITHVVADGTPVAVSPTPTTVPNTLHNAWCDGCSMRIRGVRHKCLDCADFDFCDACSGREHSGGTHEFYALVEPGEVIVRNLPQSSATPVPPETSARSRGFANGRVNVAPAPLRVPSPGPRAPSPSGPSPSRRHHRPPRPSRPALPASHSAACDLCSLRIRGVRYKCVACPDYDVCESCFRLSEEVHPGHSFAKLHQQGDIVVRKSTQSGFRHHARCDVCQNQIIGVRYKCVHPSCPDFDICERCEAMPFPVHPETHPFVKLRSHISNYDGLRNVFSFAADRGRVVQPEPSTLHAPAPVVRIPSPRAQIPNPHLPRSPRGELATATEVFHSATPSPIASVPTLGCTIVPHTTIVASLPQSPVPEPIRLSPQVVPPPVIPAASTPIVPSPPPIPASLLQGLSPERRLTDSWAAASSSANLDEHKMHHSNMYKPSYEAPSVVPARITAEEHNPVATEDEVRAARVRLQETKARLNKFKVEFSRRSAAGESAARSVTVQEEHDPEAPQMTLVNSRPVSLADVSVHEPIVVSAPVVTPPRVPSPVVVAPVPVVAQFVPIPVPIVPEPAPSPVSSATPEPAEAPASDLPSLLSAYPYRPAIPPSPSPSLPTAAGVSEMASSSISSISVLSFDASGLNASFVEDRSIVDGQVVSGGAEFAKCWRMRNTGPTAWPKGTTISFVGGHNMLIEPDMFHWAVSGDLSPGQDVDVEVDMKAPEEPGRYVSYWRLKTPDGEAFGARVWCDVVVAEMERAGSSGSSEVAASSIIVPHAPGMSAASAFSHSAFSRSASPTLHSVPSTVHTASIADTSDVESIGSIESDDSAIWAEVRRNQAQAESSRSPLDEDRFEMICDTTDAGDD